MKCLECLVYVTFYHAYPWLSGVKKGPCNIITSCCSSRRSYYPFDLISLEHPLVAPSNYPYRYYKDSGENYQIINVWRRSQKSRRYGWNFNGVRAETRLGTFKLNLGEKPNFLGWFLFYLGRCCGVSWTTRAFFNILSGGSIAPHQALRLPPPLTSKMPRPLWGPFKRTIQRYNKDTRIFLA